MFVYCGVFGRLSHGKGKGIGGREGLEITGVDQLQEVADQHQGVGGDSNTGWQLVFRSKMGVWCGY